MLHKNIMELSISNHIKVDFAAAMHLASNNITGKRWVLESLLNQSCKECPCLHVH